MTGSGTSGGGASLSAAMTIRLLPTRRKPRLLASRMKRSASSQLTSTSRTVIWPLTEESVTILKPHSLARARRTWESSALGRSVVILGEVTKAVELVTNKFLQLASVILAARVAAATATA